tara:strand:- start:517 stop:786 length:270 start_codon:yes stop_codon:yes gene_type:complete
MQFIFRFCIKVMENVYVWMDARIKRPVDTELLGVYIDMDFGSMSRHQLCSHAEKRFGLEEDALWNLQSTSKIRLACQLARNMKKTIKTK